MAEGTYYSACKPNMVGDLVGSTQLTVTPGESVELSADDKEAEDQAVTNYTSYVKGSGRSAQDRHRGVHPGLRVRGH